MTPMIIAESKISIHRRCRRSAVLEALSYHGPFWMSMRVCGPDDKTMAHRHECGHYVDVEMGLSDYERIAAEKAATVRPKIDGPFRPI